MRPLLFLGLVTTLSWHQSIAPAKAPTPCEPTFSAIQNERTLPWSYVDQAVISIPHLFPKNSVQLQRRISMIGSASYSLIVYRKDAAADETTIEGAAVVDAHAWTFTATCESKMVLDGLTTTMERIASLRSPPESARSATALFGAYGSIGIRPLEPPPGFDLWFAVVVIEVDSPQAQTLQVSDFSLADKDGKTTRFRSVVSIEEFNRARVASEGSAAFYLNSGGTTPFTGTLPAGKTRLRIKVSLLESPHQPVRFRLAIGPYVVEGPISVQWPTAP